jgi:branched-chain amino acid transport system permease protein
VGFLVGAAISVTIALLVGWPVLRLTGYFLALATLALSIIGSSLFYEWDWLTGGELGIGGIPKLDVLGFKLDTPARYYYLVWGPLYLRKIINLDPKTLQGPLDRALRAWRRRRQPGIDMQWLRTRVFMMRCWAASRGLFAHYVSFTSVQSFTVDKSIGFLLIPVLGGVRSLWASCSARCSDRHAGTLSRIGDIHQILFGLALVAVVVLLPEGLVGLLVTAGRKLGWSRVRA